MFSLHYLIVKNSMRLKCFSQEMNRGQGTKKSYITGEGTETLGKTMTKTA